MSLPLSAFLLEQQARIRRISTSYILRPSQFTPKPKPRAVVVQPDRIPHGALNGYTRHGCRCRLCRLTWNEYFVAHRAAKREAKRRYTDRTQTPSLLHASEVQ